MDEYEDRDNLIYTVSKFNRSHFEQLKKDVPPALINKLNRIMINGIFATPKEIQEVPSSGQVYSLIRTRLQFLLSADDDDDRKKEIQNCMTVLEELHDDDDGKTNEMNVAVLSCLYTLSMIKTRTRRKRSKNVRNLKFPYPYSSDSQRDTECHPKSSNPSDILRVDSGLYLNSGRFNDINWDLLQGKADTKYRSKPLKPLKKVPHDDQGLYLNSGNFNDINWDLFHGNLDTDHRQRSDERFTSEFKHKLWNWEINRPVEPLLDDEGFSTPGSNFSERLGEQSADNSDSEVLSSSADSELDGQIRSSWEEGTLERRHQEPRFISDHDESILYLWKVWNANRPTRDPVPSGLQICFEELKTDINHLMFGVASNSFWFAPTTKTFHVREMLHLPYLTPEALADYCAEYLACGNHFEALRDFTMTKSKIKGCGPIHRTFCRCVQNILQMHRYGLLITKWENIHTLSLLEAVLSPLRRKLSFTKDLCAIYTNDEDHENKLGHGVLLLDRLYASLILMETTDLKFLTLYFFECCCNIYLKVVSEWLFNGCFSSPANYDEFFVQIQHELEVCWDWRRLSYVRVNEKRIPQCLKKFFIDIFACGKSVNLLRIFTKKEIFERILPRSYPSIRCCFNATQIDAYTLEWENFRDNFYKKRSWSVRVEDRLIQRYSADFRNVVRETRRKWFEDFEIHERRKKGSSTHISEELNDGDEESPTVSSSNLDKKIEVVGLDSCSAANLFEVDDRNKSERASSDAVAGSGNGLLDKTVSSGRTDWHDTEFESSPAVIVRSSAHEGGGDSATPMRCISPFTMNGSEFQRNRQNSTSGDGFRQSITSSFPQKDEKFTSTPLSVCVQNRLKNMSVTFNNEPIKSNSDVVTPMSDCARNRMNVMRSEYHERLSNSNPVPFEVATNRIPFDESEFGKNKLKVLSSEYHIRLTALAEQEIAISRKFPNENSKKKLERERNQEETPSVHNEENFVARNSGSIPSLENTIANLVEDINMENDYIHDDAVSTASKDQEANNVSENQITIIENLDEASSTEENAPAAQSVANETPTNRVRHSKYRNFFPKPVNISTSQLLVSADSVKNVDITSILYYLPPSISIPLRIQSKLVNEAILWVFIEQEGYLEHLKTLKNYVLLGKAEFSQSMTNSLFETSEEIKSPSFLLNSYSLNSILQRALSACNSKHLVKFERNLSFVLEDQIPDFFVLTDIQMFRCLSMHYTVKWPVNVLITEPIVKKYSRIFRFLIQLQRISWVLKTDFRDMKNLKRGKSIQYTQVQLFRHTMTQVIRLLKEYVMREALEQCWNDLVHNLMNAKINLDELYMMHLKYINKIIQRCFLCEDSIIGHKAILHVFGSVLKYHDALRRGSWCRNEEFNLLYHTNFKNLCVAFQEFGKNLDNFRAVLRTLVYQKQKMYFESLLLQLDSDTKNETEL